MPIPAEWVRVAALGELSEGTSMSVQVQGCYVALHRPEGGEVYATSDVCTHQFARLSDGWLDGCAIVCPLHGGQFDVCTGAPVGGPVRVALPIFEIRLSGSEVWLRVDPATGKPRQKNHD